MSVTHVAPEHSSPPLRTVVDYLSRSGWRLIDGDNRTTLWRRETAPRNIPDDLHIVLPTNDTVTDYDARLNEAVRVLAYAEQRLPNEVVDDIGFGGADSVAVRLTPNAPAGEAPLELMASALAGIRDFLVGAAVGASEPNYLVLPSRRPARAERYTDLARVSTQAGSFVLTVSMPHDDHFESDELGTASQEQLFTLPPYGRRVTDRMFNALRQATEIARSVNVGERSIDAFGDRTRLGRLANATELAGLAEIGGPNNDPYQVRFSRSPLTPGSASTPPILISREEQEVFGRASTFLRTKQPRQDVTVRGYVVRLAREKSSGSGEVSILGPDDDSGSPHKISAELDEHQYHDAVNAHQGGYPVEIVGDMSTKGNTRWLNPVRAFSIISQAQDEGTSQ